MRRSLILIIALAIIGGVYCFIRFKLLKSKDFKPDQRKASNVLDLRPSLIAKLQQLVKDGSGGLYHLSIGSLDPDVLASTLDASDIKLDIDSAGLKQLTAEKKLPDDVFRISVKALHIDGLGIEDLLHKDRINVGNIRLSDPVIEDHHHKLAYNEKPPQDRSTLYQRLMTQMRYISIRGLQVQRGSLLTFGSAKGHPDRQFREITILLNDILIDSSTQYASDRCLFAKKLQLQSRDFSVMSPDSTYLFRIASLSVSGDQHQIVANDVELKPRQSRQEFVRKLVYRDELFYILFPKVVLSGVSWWDLLHGEQFVTAKAEAFNGEFSVYLNKSVPDSPSTSLQNFPSQLLMQVPFPVSIKNVRLHNQRIVYDEYNPQSKKDGILSFDGMEAEGGHISNIPAEYKASPVASLGGQGFFMKTVPIRCNFRFDMLKHKTGNFQADIHMGRMEHDAVNAFSEPMALLNFPRGELIQADTHVSGDNFGAKGTIDCRYQDLHMNVMKEKDDHFKKKTFTTLIGNLFLIKNQNPGKNGKLRTPDFSAVRDHRDNFFSLLWIAIKTGLLKTVGMPVKLGVKNDG